MFSFLSISMSLSISFGFPISAPLGPWGIKRPPPGLLCCLSAIAPYIYIDAENRKKFHFFVTFMGFYNFGEMGSKCFVASAPGNTLELITIQG